MTIRKPHQPNELDILIQQTLESSVADKHPPRSVWWRIKRLTDTAWIHQVRRWRWSLVVQLAVVMLLMFGSNASIYEWQIFLQQPVPQFTPTMPPAQMETETSTGIIVQVETQEMHTLKVALHRDEHQRVVPTPPLVMPPTDVLRLSTDRSPNSAEHVQRLAYVFPVVFEGGELE